MIFYLNILLLNQAIFVISFLLTTLILIIFCGFLIILFFDSVYRPNIPQYPFNAFFDRFIPISSILFPFFMIILFKPFETWFARLLLLICFNIFVLVPMLHYWSKLRQWNEASDKIALDSWKHPRLYRNINMALIYPLFWGLYCSMARFLRLGKSYDVEAYLSTFDLNSIILSIFFLPYIVCWFLIILFHISKIRKYLWSQVHVLLYSSHIYLLQFYIYFRLMEFIYKSAFFVECIITINISNKHNQPWWQRLTNGLYYNPKWFTILLLSFLLLELILTKKLYYSIYILFVYPIVYSILSCYFSYLGTNFVFDSCFSDYCNPGDHFSNPHYPLVFWNYFKDAEYHFGFQYEFTHKQTIIIANNMNKREAQWSLRKKVSYYDHQDSLNKRIFGQINSKFCLRLASNYLHTNRVRWVHTERLITNGYKYHSCTALFAKTIYQKITLLNSSWSHMKHIQAVKDPIQDIPPNMYKPSKKVFPLLRKDFIGHQEINAPDNFNPLMEKGVKVEPYDPNNAQHKPVFLSQTNPDIIYIFKDSEFIDKRSHAVDQKTNNPGLGNNKILSEITTERYNSTIDRFERHLRSLQPINTDIRDALSNLKKTSEDFIQHQIMWGKNSYLFPNAFMPPLRVPQNFSYAQFTVEALQEIKRAEIQMKKVSDFLYARKIPQVNKGAFPKEALDLFEDSVLQKILGEALF